MRTEGVEAGNEGGVGVQSFTPCCCWCCSFGVQLEKKSYQGFCATIQKRGHRAALCPASNPAPPFSLPSPRLRLNHHPIYLQLRSAKSFQSSETNGPHARPSIPGAMHIRHSKPPSYPGLDYAKILYAGIPSSVSTPHSLSKTPDVSYFSPVPAC